MAKITDFSKELKELEQIVQWFESSEVDLDQALPKFERGMELAARLKQHLEQVENKVEVIKKKFDKPLVEESTNPPAEPATNSDLFAS